MLNQEIVIKGCLGVCKPLRVSIFVRRGVAEQSAKRCSRRGRVLLLKFSCTPTHKAVSTTDAL